MTLKQTETPGPVQIEQTTNRTNKFETARKCPAATCIVRKNVAARSPGPCSSLSPSTAQKRRQRLHAPLKEPLLRIQRTHLHGHRDPKQPAVKALRSTHEAAVLHALQLPGAPRTSPPLPSSAMRTGCRSCAAVSHWRSYTCAVLSACS